ncbi:MAG: response regulator transcription factor [Ardenticatenaceae bacterium]|nr:response regulator transcription factor [Ardenticatenaceae bacterium]
MQEAVILLVEAKRAGGDSMAPALTKAGYELKVVHTGTAAYDLVKDFVPDLVIFDASSMRSSGSRSCRRLRRELGEAIPIIHSRALNEIEDSTAEADIYLEHPFTARKLLNRVRALLPADEVNGEVVRCGGITLYLSKPSVEVIGKSECRLTPKLANLLEEFVRHPNEIISRRQLMQNVWNTDYIGDTRTLDVHIRWMREIIEVDPAKPKLLKTVRGKGYVFTVPPPEKADCQE